MVNAISNVIFQPSYSNGEWSEDEQVCEDRINCPVKGPDVEGDGNTFCYGNSPGSLCEIMCPHGYELIGDDKSVCGEDGIWKGIKFDTKEY